jgi:predicted nucleic acid-binding protein
VIVLDASAVVDVLLDRPNADWVRTQLHDQALSAPAHQPAEVISAVARLIRAGQLRATTALDVIAEFSQLPQSLISPTRDHLQRALALQPRVRVVDGLYVALAEALTCPLVTTDLKLALSGLPVEVHAPDPPSE